MTVVAMKKADIFLDLVEEAFDLYPVEKKGEVSSYLVILDHGMERPVFEKCLDLGEEHLIFEEFLGLEEEHLIFDEDIQPWGFGCLLKASESQMVASCLLLILVSIS